jgi:hypothetical protein
VHPRYEVDRALSLVAEGLNDCEVSRRTGISRRTILDWRHGRAPHASRTRAAARGPCPRCESGPLDEPAYSYLLGLYLGDGWLSRDPRAYRLRIVQDLRYPNLIELAITSIKRVRDGNGTVNTSSRVGCIEICASWQHWPCLFPQHGPGRKHHRSIVLEDWQNRIVGSYPRQLLRGLIHSDGCRTINRVRDGRYAYPRYFFTNHSTDILEIFRQACDAAQIAHSSPKLDTISIARREAVAALDAFIGPKS